jgi:hypothetical protein
VVHPAFLVNPFPSGMRMSVHFFCLETLSLLQ